MAQLAVKRAVEFDGPVHYLSAADGAERRLNGKSRFKQRLLHRSGWDVLHVPYFEWESLDSPDAQRAYLAKRIEPWTTTTNSAAGGTPPQPH